MLQEKCINSASDPSQSNVPAFADAFGFQKRASLPARLGIITCQSGLRPENPQGFQQTAGLFPHWRKILKFCANGTRIHACALLKEASAMSEIRYTAEPTGSSARPAGVAGMS